jgi:hypothetical protein
MENSYLSIDRIIFILNDLIVKTLGSLERYLIRNQAAQHPHALFI